MGWVDTGLGGKRMTLLNNYLYNTGVRYLGLIKEKWHKFLLYPSKMKTRNICVRLDDHSVWVIEDDVEKWRLPWESVTRIGFATTDIGPFAPDYFYILRDNSNPPLFFMLEMGWNGVRELYEFIEKTRDVKYPPEGNLANCTYNKTTTIWPPSESGKPLGLWGDT